MARTTAPPSRTRRLFIIFIALCLVLYCADRIQSSSPPSFDIEYMPAVRYQFTCVKECGIEAPNQRRLNHHKSSCAHARADEQKKEAIRARRAERVSNGRRDARQMRLQQLQPIIGGSRSMAPDSTSPVRASGSAQPPTSVTDPMLVDAPLECVEQENSPLVDSPIVIDTALPPEPEPPQRLTASGRPARNTRRPARYRNKSPEPPAPLDGNPVPPSDPLPPTSILPRIRLIVRDTFVSAVNSFNIFRRYQHRPSHDPDADVGPEDLASRPSFHQSHDGASDDEDSAQARNDAAQFAPPWPYSNITIYRIMAWQNNGNTLKTNEELNTFVREVMKAPDYEAWHLDGFDADRENARLSKALAEAPIDAKSHPFFKQFQETWVTIDVPSGVSGAPPVPYSVPGLLHVNLTTTIKAAFQDSLAQHLHYTPFELRHATGEGTSERVHGELYNSDVFIKEYDNVCLRAPTDDPTCQRERTVAALMLASDAAHLTNFGTAKAWPIYLMLGNHSKYIRSAPSSGALHHLAYIPSLPSDFATFGQKTHAKWATQQRDITTHCRRELMHAVWKVILDAEFLHAYKNGMVILCSDGVERRVYPRIFTYSADYPEKVLLATIRDGGLCPCPRCLVTKPKLDRLGMKRDMATRLKKARTYLRDRVEWARRAIYKFAHPIGGTLVNTLLKDFSGVPTSNAFAEKLGDSFNPSDMLVVDLLHEFELGVWKTVFTHLIRMLYAVDPKGALVQTLNERYRHIDPFGRGTIRRFGAKENVSEMKKMAARDFEDLLQCAIPCFEMLFGREHDTKVLELLYRFAEWHALAKLRMHTDSTLDLLDKLTQEFGKLAREFEQLSRSYNTVELPKEANARARRQARKAAVATGLPAPPQPEAVAASAPSARKARPLNLATYKFHALGDYVQSIRLYGTTDSYSTQLGELAHRLVKKLYQLTNKKGAMKQVATKYARHDFFRAEKKERRELKKASSGAPYVISQTRKHNFDLYEFAKEHRDDPAAEKFIEKLLDHLLGRRLGREFDGDDYDFTDQDRQTIHINNSRLYFSQLLRINYTTYDVRRDYDCISARQRGFVMTRSPEVGDDVHPYWYAQVLGIYRADVRHVGTLSKDVNFRPMDFLWVRWLGKEPNYAWGRTRARLPKVGFIPQDMPDAFGFLDPSLVIRGAHLLPSFVDERTTDLLRAGPSLARPPGQTDDWTNYYVGIFVDRDMCMRHLGGGIGHLHSARCLSSTTSNAGPDDDSAHDPDEHRISPLRRDLVEQLTSEDGVPVADEDLITTDGAVSDSSRSDCEDGSDEDRTDDEDDDEQLDLKDASDGTESVGSDDENGF
ncbi:hypothetical protein EV121DRAFT_294941 [Schizophyllum commune]